MKKIIMSLATGLVAATTMAAPVPPTKGTIIVLKKGQVDFQITLKSNPTTGFRWYLGRCAHGIKPLTAKFVPPSGKLVGAPGQVTWQFKIQPQMLSVPRVMKLQLLYMRAWDYASASKKTFWIVTS